MGLYRYLAYDKLGKTQKGLIEADSARKARELLQKKEWLPTEIESVHEKKKFMGFKRVPKVSAMDLAAMTRELSTLVDAALPLEQALQATAEQTENKRLSEIMLSVRDKVREGYTLSKGLEAYSDVFSPIYLGTIMAGEQSGRLGLVLSHLADYTENQYRMKQRILQALIYPLLMMSVSLIIVIFLLTAVVPNMVDMFRESKAQLPVLTVILLTLSDFFREYGLILLGVMIVIAFGFRKLLQRQRVKEWFEKFTLRIPVIGKAVQTINTARYCRTLGILFEAGVSIVIAMNSAADVVRLTIMRKSLREATTKVSEGMLINTALKRTGYFLPMTIHFIANGERAGELSAMLKRAADNQDHKMSLLIEMALTIFEPVLILAMGVIVLFIVLATLLPLFEMTQLL